MERGGFSKQYMTQTGVLVPMSTDFVSICEFGFCLNLRFLNTIRTEFREVLGMLYYSSCKSRRRTINFTSQTLPITLFSFQTIIFYIFLVFGTGSNCFVLTSNVHYRPHK